MSIKFPDFHIESKIKKGEIEMRFLLPFIFLFSSISSYAVQVPSNYGLLEKNNGIITYKHRSEEIYAIVVDTSKANIKFNGVMEYYSNDTYYKGTLENHLNRNRHSQTVAILNGQFFDRLGNVDKYYTNAPAKLSFPVKSDYMIISSRIYDNNFSLRSILINSSGKVYFRDEFSEIIFHGNTTKEYLTGLLPSNNKSPNESIGRNYIGGITTNNCNPNLSTCEYGYVIFFIAKKSNHYDMMSQFSQWNIPDKARIMMDGSDSSQMIIKSFTGSYLRKITTLRRLPHTILIENK